MLDAYAYFARQAGGTVARTVAHPQEVAAWGRVARVSHI
jgi:hypothetical protein